MLNTKRLKRDGRSRRNWAERTMRQLGRLAGRWPRSFFPQTARFINHCDCGCGEPISMNKNYKLAHGENK